MKGNSQSVGTLLLLMLAGIVLGGFFAQLAVHSPTLGWLAYGKNIGLTEPLVLDMGVFTLQLGFSIRFTVAGIFGILLACFVYRRL